MKPLKDFYKNLIDKYWQKYQKDIISADFPYSIREEIKSDIKKYLNENELYSTYNRNDYENDSDEYVKYAAYNQIKKMFDEEVGKRWTYNITTPKRFKINCPQRDW